MKDKRNCGNNMGYPIYQAPVMMPPMGYPMNYQGSIPITNMGGSNILDQQFNNIEQQLSLLDQRITRLERMNNTTSNNYNKYNDSNYYMV